MNNSTISEQEQEQVHACEHCGSGVSLVAYQSILLCTPCRQEWKWYEVAKPDMAFNQWLYEIPSFGMLYAAYSSPGRDGFSWDDVDKVWQEVRKARLG